jgi:hypothetical protein
MVTTSKKVLVALMVLPVLVVVLAVAAWQDWGGIGTAISGFGGPLGAGALSLAQTPLTWAVSGGGPTTAALYAVIGLAIVGFAYWVWHWDIGYRLQNTFKPDVPTNAGFTNTMSREPSDPERAPV